jgi:hypothetical protein
MSTRELLLLRFTPIPVGLPFPQKALSNGTHVHVSSVAVMDCPSVGWGPKGTVAVVVVLVVVIEPPVLDVVVEAPPEPVPCCTPLEQAVRERSENEARREARIMSPCYHRAARA